MVKPFYVDTAGAWVLGYNQENGAGSQLQAGARAELIPSPITQALSTFGGRIAAQTMQYMYRGNVKSLHNYVAFRPYAMMDAIKLALGESRKDKIVLNPHAGYSPVFYWLAKEFKDTQFIEMDTQKVIQVKHRALQPFDIPPNLTFRSVDLKEYNLHEVQAEPVDVLLTFGAYVSHSDYRDMLRYIKNVLKDDACIIAPFPNKSGIENFLENSTVFSRIVTQPKGALNDEHELTSIFKDTGFTVTQIIKLSDLAQKYEKPSPADIELIALAKLGVKLEADEADDDEFDLLAELNDILPAKSPENIVPPFHDVDVNSFRRFPKRNRSSKAEL